MHKTELLHTTRSRRRGMRWEWWNEIAKMLLESAETYSVGETVRWRVTVPTWGTYSTGKKSADLRGIKRRSSKIIKDKTKPRVRWADNAETMMMTIAWGDHTNDELAVEFRHWLKENRPKDIPQPDRRGEQFRHWACALRRLGIMRLKLFLHAASVVGLVSASMGALSRPLQRMVSSTTRSGEVLSQTFSIS